MFDIGWSEMLLTAAVAVLVIGPKDIPKIMYQVGRFFRRLQYMKFAMSQQFDDILKAGDIEELRKGVNFEAKATPKEAASSREPDAERLADEEEYAPPDEGEDIRQAGEANANKIALDVLPPPVETATKQ